jgi:hypothetical protein
MEEKDKKDLPKANIVGETNREIMSEKPKKKENGDVSDEEVEQQNVLLGPDPDSLNKRG